MKTLSNKEMASGLNVAPARVSEWEKRGMPMTSVEAAQSWRRVHAPPRARRAAPAPQSRHGKPSSRAPGHPAPAQGDGSEALLQRTREVERQIFDSIAKAIRQGDVTLLARLQSARAAALKEIKFAEEMVTASQLESGEVVRTAEVREMIVALLVPLRERLDKLPLNLRTDCNHDHPEQAQRALEEWRLVTLEYCARAENPFPREEQISAPITSENG